MANDPDPDGHHQPTHCDRGQHCACTELGSPCCHCHVDLTTLQPTSRVNFLQLHHNHGATIAIGADRLTLAETIHCPCGQTWLGNIVDAS